MYGGIIQRIRIHAFCSSRVCGKKIKASPTLNSITLAGVGNKTIIENVMSYSGGGRLGEWRDLNVAKLVSYYCVNDDYKFSYGAQVKSLTH
jgi:hypothetical protein